MVVCDYDLDDDYDKAGFYTQRALAQTPSPSGKENFTFLRAFPHPNAPLNSLTWPTR